MSSSFRGLSILSLILSAATASAQTPCIAKFDDNVFDDGVSVGGPNTVAIRFVAQTSIIATSIEVLTGEATGVNSVQIWSNGPSNLPAFPLISGSWSMSPINGWQGAALNGPLQVNAGQTYWLGWTPMTGAQASVDTTAPGNGQVYRTASGTGGWLGPFQDSKHWKFRIFGNCTAPVITPFCAGDGVAPHTACPCGNNSPTGFVVGCLNSFGEGAILESTGIASLAIDTLVLNVGSLPASSVLFFQGTTRENGGNGSGFGDGLRCAGGSVIRLGTLAATGTPGSATSTYPQAGDSSVSVRGSILAPGLRTYQAWYRDSAAFCASSTFNFSNGLEILWSP